MCDQGKQPAKAGRGQREDGAPAVGYRPSGGLGGPLFSDRPRYRISVGVLQKTKHVSNALGLIEKLEGQSGAAICSEVSAARVGVAAV